MSTLAEILAGSGDATDNGFAFDLDGSKLHPFSGWRYRLADALGLRFFRAMSTAAKDDKFREDLRNGSYPGVESDVALVLWICYHSRDEIGWASDSFQRQRALDAVDEWSDKIGLSPGGRSYDRGGEVAMRYLFEVLEVLEKDDELGENEKKNGSRESSPIGPDTGSQ